MKEQAVWPAVHVCGVSKRGWIAEELLSEVPAHSESGAFGTRTTVFRKVSVTFW